MKNRSGRAPQGRQSSIARGHRALPGFILGLCLAGVASGDERPPDLNAICGRWMMNPVIGSDENSNLNCDGMIPQPRWERHEVQLVPFPELPDDLGGSPDDPRNEPDSPHFWMYSSIVNRSFDHWNWQVEAKVNYPVGTAYTYNFLNMEVGVASPKRASALYEREDTWEWVPCYDSIPCPPQTRRVGIHPSGIMYLFTEATVGRQVNDWAMATASAESLLLATVDGTTVLNLPTTLITATAHMKRMEDLSALAVRLQASGEAHASGGVQVGGGGAQAGVHIEGETNRNSENGGTDSGIGIAESTATVILEPWDGMSADTVTARIRNRVRTMTRSNSGDDLGSDNSSQGSVEALAEFILAVDAE